jgi:hypothetical protein
MQFTRATGCLRGGSPPNIQLGTEFEGYPFVLDSTGAQPSDARQFENLRVCLWA